MNPSTMTPSILTRPPLDHHLRGNYPLELESNPAWPQIRSCIRAAYPFVFSSVCLPGSTAHAMTIPSLEPPQAVTDPEYNHSPFDLAFYAFENPPNMHHSIPTTPAHLAVLILTPECLEEANTMMTYRKIQNFLGVNDHEKKIIYFLAGNNEDESFRAGNLVAMNMFLRTCFEYQRNMCPVIPLVEPQFLMHDILLKASYPKEHFCVLDRNGHLQRTLGDDDVFIWDCTHASLSSNQAGSDKRKLEYRKREIKEYLARGRDLTQRELLDLFCSG